MNPFNRTAGLLLAESKLIPETRVLAPASAVLQGLLDDAPADQFTLAWLLGHLHRRSFGFIMLLLALVAMLPGISYVAGLLLLVPALEMIAGRVAPVFPRRIAARPLPTRHLDRVVEPGHSGSEVSREGDPSALAHAVGGYQTCGRRRSAAADRAAAARAGANDPSRAGFGDRDDLTGLPRGGRSSCSRSRFSSPSLSWQSRGWRSGKWSWAPSGLADLGFRAPPRSKPYICAQTAPAARYVENAGPKGTLDLSTFFPFLLPSSRPSLPFF